MFHEHRSETSLMRWLRRLADADLALDRTMIPLGSCTMKLNAAAEMEPISWPEFANLHPFAPRDDAAGTLEHDRGPGAVARGAHRLRGGVAAAQRGQPGRAGRACWRSPAYHRSRGEGHRDVCLIPASAHGTNAASAR